jgi:hypothetical protein
MNQGLAKCPSKSLYLSYANFLKHLESIIPDSYTKIVGIFERGIADAELSQEDR